MLPGDFEIYQTELNEFDTMQVQCSSSLALDDVVLLYASNFSVSHFNHENITFCCRYEFTGYLIHYELTLSQCDYEV